MAKRKLSKNQTRRLKDKESASIRRAKAKSEFEDEALGPEREGLVIAHYGTQADIQDAQGKNIIRCHLRATIQSIVAGDEVIWRQGKDLGVVVSIQPRTTALHRPDSYGNLKAVAANVDQMIITIAPKPEPFTNLIDRYLVAAEVHGITPIIIINKSDLLVEFKRDAILRMSALYEKLGYRVIQVSAHQADTLAELEQTLIDKNSIFVGQSGVGKSSLVKALIPEKDIKVGDLSHSEAKGRHTTTHSQLFHFPKGGAFIDSPGIREFGLWHIEKEDVIEGFPELKEAASECKFRNCSHNKEPGCAIKAALKNALISEERFKNYQQIINTLSEVEIKKNTFSSNK